MKLLALDPSLSLTGWAVLDADGSPNGALVGAGVVRIKPDRSLHERVHELRANVAALADEHAVTTAVVEVPASKGRPWGGYADRNVLTIPNYGMAVAACLLAFPAPNEYLMCVPADEWSVGIRRGDKDKTNRVRHAAWLYQVEPESFGPKSLAGNVADAVLLARWAMLRREAVRA